MFSLVAKTKQKKKEETWLGIRKLFVVCVSKVKTSSFSIIFLAPKRLKCLAANNCYLVWLLEPVNIPSISYCQVL